MTNDLETFLELQTEFMSIIGVDSSIKGVDSLEIQDAILGIIEESTEINREFRKRVPWRHTQPDEAIVFEESIDVFFYLLEIWILMGKSANDVTNEFHKKLRKNILRFAEKSKLQSDEH